MTVLRNAWNTKFFFFIKPLLLQELSDNMFKKGEKIQLEDINPFHRSYLTTSVTFTKGEKIQPEER